MISAVYPTAIHYCFYILTYFNLKSAFYILNITKVAFEKNSQSSNILKYFYDLTFFIFIHFKMLFISMMEILHIQHILTPVSCGLPEIIVIVNSLSSLLILLHKNHFSKYLKNSGVFQKHLLNRRKKLKLALNKYRVNKWQNFYLWVNYPFRCRQQETTVRKTKK